MSNVSKRVERAIDEGKIPGATDSEVDILIGIIKRHPKAEPMGVMVITAALQSLGFGRNQHAASCLRAAADLIESPIPTAESIEAKLDGKLQ